MHTGKHTEIWLVEEYRLFIMILLKLILTTVAKIRTKSTKPKIQASRIGQSSSDSAGLKQNSLLLINFCKKLNCSNEIGKTVFISPDRSADEREQQRNIVTELNRLITEHPNRYHIISAGRVQSVDKTHNLSPMITLVYHVVY